MGLLDKVKEQASQTLEKATKASVAGQAKLDAFQAKRQVDQLLRQIGAAVYTQQTGGSAADVSELVSQIQQIESTHGGLVAQAGDPDDASEAPPSPSA